MCIFHEITECMITSVSFKILMKGGQKYVNSNFFGGGGGACKRDAGGVRACSPRKF